MLTKKYPILRINDQDREELEDDVVLESAVQINLNGTELATILACPCDEKDLGVGFLVTEGFIEGPSELRGFEQKGSSLYFTVDEEKFKKEQVIQKYITSGCGRGTSFALARKSLKSKKIKSSIAPLATADQISDLMSRFQRESETYMKTGGVHSASLCTPTEGLIFSEDIGRHNAVDRVIGRALLEGVALGDKLLVSSGRVSSEIARKVAFAEIPVLVSRSAPTDRALWIADELGLTVVGFARGRRMNVYTHKERVK
jgi:FdhD protein